MKAPPIRLVAAAALACALASGSASPAKAGELPGGSVILARTSGDAIIVWDSTDELLGMLTKKERKAEILRSLEADAARILVDRAGKIKDRAKTVTVNVTYKRVGAISAVYKTATFEGSELLLRMKAPIAAATSRNSWPADIAAGRRPKNLDVVVIGELPPDVK